MSVQRYKARKGRDFSSRHCETGIGWNLERAKVAATVKVREQQKIIWRTTNSIVDFSIGMGALKWAHVGCCGTIGERCAMAFKVKVCRSDENLHGLGDLGGVPVP